MSLYILSLGMEKNGYLRPKRTDMPNVNPTSDFTLNAQCIRRLSLYIYLLLEGISVDIS